MSIDLSVCRKPLESVLYLQVQRVMSERVWGKKFNIPGLPVQKFSTSVKPLQVKAPAEEHLQVKAPAEEHLPVKAPAEEHLQVKAPVEEHLQVKAPAEEHLQVKAPAEEHLQVKAPAEEHLQVKAPAEELNRALNLTSNCLEPPKAGEKRTDNLRSPLTTNETFLIPYLRKNGLQAREGLGRRRELLDVFSIEAALLCSPPLTDPVLLPHKNASKV